MFSSFATVNIDTDFRAPPDCPRKGDVDCRVVRAECEVIAKWDHWVTFKVRLRLRIGVRHHSHSDGIFFREIVIKETVWLDCHLWIKACEVVATACRCVINRSRIHCNLTVKVEFFLKKKSCRHWEDDRDEEHDGHWLGQVVQALPRLILPL